MSNLWDGNRSEHTNRVEDLKNFVAQYDKDPDAIYDFFSAGFKEQQIRLIYKKFGTKINE